MQADRGPKWVRLFAESRRRPVAARLGGRGAAPQLACQRSAQEGHAAVQGLLRGVHSIRQVDGGGQLLHAPRHTSAVGGAARSGGAGASDSSATPR